MKNMCFALIMAVAAAGCGSDKLDGDCSAQMEDLRNERGEPQEIRRLDSDRFHQHTWWYGGSGFARIFTWDGSTGSCTTADQTFDPAGQDGRP